jgi:uncharacterized protein YecE (DUF72 family)
MEVRVGTAGWGIPRAAAETLTGEGPHLERYARVFSCVEVNSTFYRTHRASTYQRWSSCVPPDFRFALKVPKTISHERGLAACDDVLGRFFEEIAPLAGKRGPLLIQLPPSRAFDEAVAAAFFTSLRRMDDGAVACEPRHPSWFTAGAESVLRAFDVARVAADPAVVPEAARPGGSRSLEYYRWHGSPRVYFSSYDDERLESLANAQATARAPMWIIFDNTANGAATSDALRLLGRATRPG